MLDWQVAQAFYLDYLQFRVEFSDQPGPTSPVYARVTRDRAVLDLSEHHGDGTFGSVAWIDVQDIEVFHRDLRSREYRGLRPGIERGGPAGPQVDVIDPFGNVVRFHEP